MQKDKAGIFTGPLSFVLTGLVEECHRMGFRFKEEERLLHELDRMSIGFDCTGGLTQELVTKFRQIHPVFSCNRRSMALTASSVNARLPHGQTCY